MGARLAAMGILGLILAISVLTGFNPVLATLPFFRRCDVAEASRTQHYYDYSRRSSHPQATASKIDVLDLCVIYSNFTRALYFMLRKNNSYLYHRGCIFVRPNASVVVKIVTKMRIINKSREIVLRGNVTERVVVIIRKYGRTFKVLFKAVFRRRVSEIEEVKQELFIYISQSEFYMILWKIALAGIPAFCFALLCSYLIYKHRVSREIEEGI